MLGYRRGKRYSFLAIRAASDGIPAILGWGLKVMNDLQLSVAAQVARLTRSVDDVHPFLVLSPRIFNERTSLVIGLPMTTAQYNSDNPFAIPVGKASGRKTGQTCYVLCHQPKSFDWRLRKAKHTLWALYLELCLCRSANVSTRSFSLAEVVDCTPFCGCNKNATLRSPPCLRLQSMPSYGRNQVPDRQE